MKKAPNRTTAVMQRRRVVAPDSLDYFPTPPFATRALCEFLLSIGIPLAELDGWEPGCGEMHMVRPLREYLRSVRPSDVHDYPAEPHDILDFATLGEFEPMVDLVACNPPFRLAEAFIRTAMKVARIGVAMLVRSAFLEGQERYRHIWRDRSPTHILQFTERVVMLEGRLVRSGSVDPFAEKDGRTATSATAYVWLVWIKDAEPGPTQFHWIAPCLARLEKPGDYPDYEAQRVRRAAPAGALLEGMGA